jgi:putative ABC transport system permease protein
LNGDAWDLVVKFFPLVWAGIWRKRGRSILIFLQVIIAFTLFGVLQGLNSGIRHAVDATHANRLYVSSRLRVGDPLPISVMQRLETAPGVKLAAPMFQFAGQYQKPGQGMVVIATDAAAFMGMRPEFVVHPKQVEALRNTRSGVIVGAETVRRYGLKIGQRITLKSPVRKRDGSGDWSFDVVGTYENSDTPESGIALIVNYPYVNESLPEGQGKDQIAIATVLIDDPTRATAIGDGIDRLFANSANETLTQSEHELAEAQVSRIGDLSLVVHRITAATFFVLLFATGALMMQSIRERTPELAVLKTFGFSDLRVMTLILTETVVLCLAGAAVGMWLASRILLLARDQIGIGSVPNDVMIFGVVSAALLALAAGAIPSWRGLRLKVVDALADR